MGDREQRIERFAGAGVPKEKVSFVRDTYTFNFPGASSEFVDAFRKYYGPTMNAFDAAEKNGRASDLQKELEVLFASQNKSPNKVPPPFLRPSYALPLRVIRVRTLFMCARKPASAHAPSSEPENALDNPVRARDRHCLN